MKFNYFPFFSFALSFWLLDAMQRFLTNALQLHRIFGNIGKKIIRYCPDSNPPQNTGLLHNRHLRSGFSFDTFTPSLARHSEVEITGKQKGPRESQIIVFDLKELSFASKFKYEPMYQGRYVMVQIQRMSRLLSGLFFRAIYINKRVRPKSTGTVTPPNDTSDLNGSSLI